MGKVMKADGSAARAYATIDFPSHESEVWHTFGFACDADAITYFTETPSNYISQLNDEGTGALETKVFIEVGPTWSTGGLNFGGLPIAGVWQTVELHYKNDNTAEIYADGVLVVSGTANNTDGVGRSLVGLYGNLFDPAQIVYIKNPKFGTTRGGDDIFVDDFADGTFDAWTSTTGSVSIVDDPFAIVAGICIAFDDPALEPNPTWTRLDDPGGYRLARATTINRGRDSVTQEIATGTATVELIDKDGTLDPTNPDGPFYGKILPNLQAKIDRWNPITEEWSRRFTGFTKAWKYEIDVSGNLAVCTLELVDAFDFLADSVMTPGDQGDAPPPESIGDIYYAGGPSTFKHVDQRIHQALDDVEWPVAWRDIFSGNVTVQDKIYERYSQLLSVLQDAADAEFPWVANLYASVLGYITFRGRFARFFPEHPGYGIEFWHVGDAAAAAADPTVVAFSGSFPFSISKDNVYNVALPLPQGVDETDAPGQLVVDATSSSQYGRRPVPSLDNLQTYQGHNDDASTTTALEETKKFGQFLVDNYKDPRVEVDALTFTSRIDLADPNVAAVWDLLSRVELGDVVSLTTSHRGGGGFDEDFYVEALAEHDTPLKGDLHDVVVAVSLSPRSYYDSNPFGEVDSGLS